MRKAFFSKAFEIVLEIKLDYSHLEEELRHALDANDPKLFYNKLDKYFRGVPHTIFKKSSTSITDVEPFYTGILAFALQFLPEL